MIKVENIGVFNFEGAIRGMRNPMCSHNRSDSVLGGNGGFQIGENDLDLMQRLYKAGHPHRKYLRQIMVSMDITSNHTFWAEFDTYKVGVTRNSCSKMHKIHTKKFEPDDFTHENIDKVDFAKEEFDRVLKTVERCRILFNETKDKKYWRALVDLLPMGYNLKATVTMSYENVFNILQYRQGHKLNEWNEFCEILKELPYVLDIMSEKN